MPLPKLVHLTGIFGTLLLLAGCTLGVEVFLHNNTNMAIMVGPGSPGRKLTIAPHAVAKVNEYWTMNPTVTRRGKTFNYRLPMSAIPPEYQGGNQFKLWHHLEYADDNRIYILPEGALPSKMHPPQPIGFPLKPQ